MGGVCTGESDMPKNKDLKRLIRARMNKTGESYTAARVHVLSGELPLPAEYEKVAGMSDAAVKKATGRTWPEWAAELDRVDAASWEHRAIAMHLYETPQDHRQKCVPGSI